MGAFLAGLRLGFVAVLALVGASLWWRVSARSPVSRGSSPARIAGSASRGSELPNVPAAPASNEDIERLRARRLLMPVEGYDLARLRDGFRESRGTRVHHAIDLMAARGTRIRAVDDGSIRKLLTSARGGISIYQLDADGRYCYYYAHLDRYAPFLTEGKPVRKGEILGYVGSTGNASATAPHLHFAVYKLRDPSRYWDGTAVNPYPIWAGAGMVADR